MRRGGDRKGGRAKEEEEGVGDLRQLADKVPSNLIKSNESLSLLDEELVDGEGARGVLAVHLPEHV